MNLLVSSFLFLFLDQQIVDLKRKLAWSREGGQLITDKVTSCLLFLLQAEAIWFVFQGASRV